MEKRVKNDDLDNFVHEMVKEEKSVATMKKYHRDVCAFCAFAGEREITKELVIEYKNHLIEKGYAVRSINSMLASLNYFFDLSDGKTAE